MMWLVGSGGKAVGVGRSAKVHPGLDIGDSLCQVVVDGEVGGGDA